MPRITPNEGILSRLGDIVGGGGEAYELGLYKSSVALTVGMTASAVTDVESSFTGYARKTLARSVSGSTWLPVVSQAPSGTPPWSARDQVAATQYGTPQIWSIASGGESIYGYFLVGATSGKLYVVEAFDAPLAALDGATFEITPHLELG